MAQSSSSEVFGRGLEFIDLIAESREGLTIEQLADSREMHRSSIYRYIGPLLQKGYVVKSAEGRYELGVKILALASQILHRLDLRNVAHPLLIQLSETMNATVHLARLEGPEIVYLDKVETQRSLPLVSRIGGRQPAYCTGVGKALLAFLPQARLQQLIPKIEFIRFTKTTIMNPERLAAELARIRSRGYAIDNEEHEEGISCVAYPILDLYGDPIGSISATVLTREFKVAPDVYIEEVGNVAVAISRSFGYDAVKGV